MSEQMEMARDAKRQIEAALTGVAGGMYDELHAYVARSILGVDDDADRPAVADVIRDAMSVALNTARSRGVLRVTSKGSNAVSNLVDEVEAAAALAFLGRLEALPADSDCWTDGEALLEYLWFWKDASVRGL